MNVNVKLANGYSYWLGVDEEGRASFKCPYCLQELEVDVVEGYVVKGCSHLLHSYLHAFGYFVVEFGRQ